MDANAHGRAQNRLRIRQVPLVLGTIDCERICAFFCVITHRPAAAGQSEALVYQLDYAREQQRHGDIRRDRDEPAAKANLPRSKDSPDTAVSTARRKTTPAVSVHDAVR